MDPFIVGCMVGAGICASVVALGVAYIAIQLWRSW